VRDRSVRHLAGMLLVIVASLLARAAHAQSGVNIAWDDCVGSGNESYDKVVACTNSGVFNIVCSFASPEDVPQLGAVDWTLDFQMSSSTDLSWWAGPGRFAFDPRNPTGAACTQLWNLAPHGPIGVGPNFTQRSPTLFRLRGVWAFATGEEQFARANTEYYSQTVQLAFTQGAASDPGCMGSACIAMNLVTLEQPSPGQYINLWTPLANNYVSWRHANACPGAVATRKQTWGALKALYR